MTTGGRRPGRSELIAVGALFGAVLLATFVTYARIPPKELYHVSVDGIPGGLGRVVMELTFPDAVLAVPLALLAVDVLRSRWAVVLAAIAIPACLVTLVPGVFDQADIDAKPVNAVPATGVALTLVLLAAALPRLSTAMPRLAGDRLRVALAAVIAVAAIPYLFAELGFYAPGPILADEPTPGKKLAAVHLGSHEGMDGALLALAALALSRLTPWFTGRRLAGATSALLALVLAYGLANLLLDDWLEQVVKRGWTEHTIPSVVRPELSAGWALILLAAVAIELAWFRRERRAESAAP